MKTALIFGATGAIGGHIRQTFLHKGWRVLGVGRTSPDEDGDWLALDPLADRADVGPLMARGPFDAVVWAQGANGTDSVYDVEVDAHLAMYRANCLYILVTLKALLNGAALAPRARLVVISSIWQNIARQNKLSYCMSKAALQGLVQSAAVDLGRDGHLINAILPGALDTPMTRRNLAPAQIQTLEGATLFGSLPQLDDVAELAFFLGSDHNTGITGQFIAADLGFSHVRIL